MNDGKGLPPVRESSSTRNKTKHGKETRAALQTISAALQTIGRISGLESDVSEVAAAEPQMPSVLPKKLDLQDAVDDNLKDDNFQTYSPKPNNASSVLTPRLVITEVDRPRPSDKTKFDAKKQSVAKAPVSECVADTAIAENGISELEALLQKAEADAASLLAEVGDSADRRKRKSVDELSKNSNNKDTFPKSPEKSNDGPSATPDTMFSDLEAELIRQEQEAAAALAAAEKMATKSRARITEMEQQHRRMPQPGLESTSSPSGFEADMLKKRVANNARIYALEQELARNSNHKPLATVAVAVCLIAICAWMFFRSSDSDQFDDML
jgi:hypothetical protein